VAGRSTRHTVLIAGAANILVGAIKLAAGIMVGSSAILAEAAHCAADTLNQAFRLASLRQGEREIEKTPGVDALGRPAHMTEHELTSGTIMNAGTQ
jgi:Co/Zn/Cd efflux system component